MPTTPTSSKRCVLSIWATSKSIALTCPSCLSTATTRTRERPEPIPGPDLSFLWRSGLQNGLDLQVDGDLVGDHHAAVLHGGVPVDPEVLPVDVRRGCETGPGAAVGVLPEAVDLQLQRNAAGHTLERQLAVDDEVSTVAADRR